MKPTLVTTTGDVNAWVFTHAKELLIGAGARRDKRIKIGDKEGWSELLTLDQNKDHAPDVVHDLERFPFPFCNNQFEEIHAYEVLEHTGAQGDYRFFFQQFSEFWRILKPDGFLCATVPLWSSKWAWGDPSHKRVITAGSLAFLNQNEYKRQIGSSTMSDFRDIYKADFDIAHLEERGEDTFVFVLKAIKPSRYEP